MNQAYGRTLAKLGEEDRNIFTVDADFRFIVKEFAEKFPQRAIEVGIAEQNLIGVAAGIASTGKTVFANTFCSFYSRCFEQVKVDAVYNRLNVKCVGFYSDVLSGPLMPTHHALEDIGMMRSLPEIKVLVPADSLETEKTVEAAAREAGPMYIRLGKPDEVYTEDYDFKIGRAVLLREGDDVTLAATGNMVKRSLLVADILKNDGISARVINLHTIKPIDEEILIKASKDTGLIVTLELHNTLCGLGGAVAEVITKIAPCKVERIRFEDTFAHLVGSYSQILEKYNLNEKAIAEKVRDAKKEVTTYD